MNIKVPIIVLLILGILALGISALTLGDEIGIISLDKVFDFQGGEIEVSGDQDRNENTIGGGFSDSESGEMGGGSAGESSEGQGSGCNLKSVQYSVSDFDSSLNCGGTCELSCSINVKNLGDVEAQFTVILKLLNSESEVIEQEQVSHTLTPDEVRQFSAIFNAEENYSCTYEAQTPTYCA